ncbi:MAG: hypothetical protein K8I03_04255 [Ignavibacteria bacterium]|nr:hypothetical protein [Ignavibacteria bacterium]
MHFAVYILFLILKVIVPILPLPLVRFNARVIGAFFYYLIPVRKSTALSNLKLAFPEKSNKELNRIIKGCYRNVFTVIGEFLCMQRFSDEEMNKIMRITNPELIYSKLKTGRSLILISAHFGNWELTAYGCARTLGKKLNVVVKEQSNKRLDKAINEMRSSAGNKMIEMRGSLRGILNALHGGEIVAMLGDQAAPKENIRINFFVNDVPAFEGTAKIAIKTGAAVLFGVSVRNEEGNYEVTMQEIDTSKFTEASEENVKDLTQMHIDLLVEQIRKRPDHWLWFHRRFKNV